MMAQSLASWLLAIMLIFDTAVDRTDRAHLVVPPDFTLGFRHAEINKVREG